MLDKVRKPTKTRSFKKYFYVFLFAIIISTFIFMGSGSGPLGGGAAGGVAAVVNDKIITYKEFSRAYRNQEQNILDQAKNLPDALRKQYTRGLAQRVLEQMVQLELAKQLAVKSGISVSSAEIRDQISSMPTFQENGRFQTSRYQQLLTANKISTAEFEDSIRGSIAFDRFRKVFADSLKVTSEDVELENYAKSQKLNVDFLEVSRQALKKAIQVSASEQNEFAGKNAEEIKQYYDSNSAEFTSKDKVKVSHILIKTKSQSEADYKEALDKTLKVRSEITETNFAEMAKKYSEDTGSKVKGGDLGEVDEDVSFVPPFKEAVFSLPVGKLSDPVKTNFGYHIIKVMDKKSGGTEPLDKVKGQIAKKLIINKKVEKDLASLSSKEEGFNNTALEDVKKRYGLKWQNTGAFSVEQSAIPKLGSTEKFWQTLSDLKVNESKMVETDGKYYIVKLKEMNFEKVASADSKSDQGLMERLSQYRSGDAVQSWVDNKSKSARIKRNIDPSRYQ